MTPEQICQKHCLVDPYGAADPVVLEAMKEYAWQEIRALKRSLRRTVADYMGSEGCSCCEGRDHREHAEALALLLGVKKYPDGSGYDFSKYQTKQK